MLGHRRGWDMGGKEKWGRREGEMEKLSHTSCVLSCSLLCFISGLSADMGGVDTS